RRVRGRQHGAESLGRAALPAGGSAVLAAIVAMLAGVRQFIPAAIVFAMAFALAGNFMVTVRGFRASWKHGVAYLGHMGASLLLIGVIASSGYGLAEQAQLPRVHARHALGYDLAIKV